LDVEVVDDPAHEALDVLEVKSVTSRPATSCPSERYTTLSGDVCAAIQDCVRAIACRARIAGRLRRTGDQPGAARHGIP